jgi:SPASM domain peptide maturase of grasp-with-spasm system
MVFKIFASCLPVKGYSRSLVCDPARQALTFIPNGLYHIMTEWEGYTRAEVYAGFAADQHAVLDEYFALMETEEWIYWLQKEDEALFPSLQETWDFPGHISNAIIDADATSQHDYASICTQLEALGCYAVQLRLFGVPDVLKVMQQFMETMEGRDIKSVELLCPYDAAMETGILEQYCSAYPRIKSILVFEAPRDQQVRVAEDNRFGNIWLAQQPLKGHQQCGIVAPLYFGNNLDFLMESMLYNTCLHRKISIDVQGFIRNCPSMPEHFGNIESTSLLQAMDKPGFKRYWNIAKEAISVCRDCEFRRVCTDCRAYLDNPKDNLSKPLKCGYNPYTCTWEDWSTHPLKQQAIAHYGLFPVS